MQRSVQLTPDDLRQRGLDALTRELGPADAARFLQQMQTAARNGSEVPFDEAPRNPLPHSPDRNQPLPSTAAPVGAAVNESRPRAPDPVHTVSLDYDAPAPRRKAFARCLSSTGFVLSGLVAAVVLLLLALFLPQLPRQRAIRAVEAAGGDVYFADSIPYWLYTLCGERIEYLESATEIHLDGTGVDDRLLSRLRLLNSAQVVWLNGAKISDQGALTLLEFPSITSLDLGDTAVTEAALVPILRCHKHLDTIWLEGTATGDAVLEVLGGTATLVNLSIDRTKVTDQGLAHLARLPELNDLDLSHTAVGDAGIAHLAACPKLTTLALGFTQVTDAGLEHLARMPELQELVLNGTPIRGPGLKHLAAARHLTSVSFNHSQLGDEGLEHIAAIKSLTLISLTGTHVTDAGLAKLETAKQLTHIYVGDTLATPEGIARLRQALPDCSIDESGDGLEQIPSY